MLVRAKHSSRPRSQEGLLAGKEEISWKSCLDIFAAATHELLLLFQTLGRGSQENKTFIQKNFYFYNVNAQWLQDGAQVVAYLSNVFLKATHR